MGALNDVVGDERRGGEWRGLEMWELRDTEGCWDERAAPSVGDRKWKV
jgi:hypothetical protein